VSDPFETSGAIGLGVSAALAQQYAQDQREFLPLIASVLKNAIPNDVEIIETGLFKKTIKGVAVRQGENRLVLEDIGHGSLQASFTRVVRGIALKTESVSVEEWVALIGEALEKSAKENLAARNALAKRLGLD
jgi:hypothetical protein